jgi:hypothetical protein
MMEAVDTLVGLIIIGVYLIVTPKKTNGADQENLCGSPNNINKES